MGHSNGPNSEVRHRGPDWIINNDADEFWSPLQGNLKQALANVPSAIDAVDLPRRNFVPTTDESAPFYEHMRVREVASLNALGNPLPPKACHRGFSDIVVSDGNHTAHRSVGPVTCVAVPNLCEILHFPLRTYEQFERKIVLGAQALKRNAGLDKDIGSTWRRLYDEYRAWSAIQLL